MHISEHESEGKPGCNLSKGEGGVDHDSISENIYINKIYILSIIIFIRKFYFSIDGNGQPDQGKGWVTTDLRN